MRSEKSIKNVLVTWLGLIFVSLGGFVIRILLARTLSEEYLGLNGLFGNVISVLSLAELGVGPAITFSLYKPIAENDERQIKALMRLYRNFYIGVGSFMLIVGLLITPFLHLIIKEMPANVDHIYFIFIMYVANAAFSYFYSYKCVYLSANQNYYMYSANHALCYIVMYVVQAGVLLTTKNFILFYAIQVVTTVIENLRISHIANKHYPILKSREKYDLPAETKKTIKVNVFAAIGHNLGNVVLNSTDNIVISKFVGLVEAGFYSNYVLITSTVNMFMNQAFQAIMSSVGNMAVEADEKQQRETFNMVYFANFWLFSFATTALLVLSNPFIELAFGQQFVLSDEVLIAICINFYATGMRQTCNVFKVAYGILIQDVHRAYIEAILNLIVSIILVQKFGILGVIIGTIVSNYAVAFWIEPKTFFKNAFHSSTGDYYWYYILYFATTVIMGVLCFGVSNMLNLTGALSIVVRLIIVCVLANVVVVILWNRNTSFKKLVSTIFYVIKNKLAK